MLASPVPPSVSVSVSFSAVRGRSDGTEDRSRSGEQPTVNAGERPCTRPREAPTQLESERLRPAAVPYSVRGRRWQVSPWPSTKPDRWLGPGSYPGHPQQSRGCSCSTELDTSEASRASETLAMGTDTRPRPQRVTLCSSHHKRTRSSGEQRGTTGRGADPDEAALRPRHPGQPPNRPQMPAASQADVTSHTGQGRSVSVDQ
jgi:hypothetical protein